MAVKTLKSEKGENRVKFLREAAIINQFKHNNVIKMYGVVLSANPVMWPFHCYSITGIYYSDDDCRGNVAKRRPETILVSYKVPSLIVTIDLNSLIRCDKTALESNLAASFLQMSRGIADGMAYLAGSSFIHRVKIVALFFGLLAFLW